ncbi:hypothetical protein ACQKQA_22285 [Pseudomonas sp. NPDC089530]|uniref:hypothetical protein n=1 Tax=Pseudomonas sp. NPDC089530 TaxID=3390651 RepID=UPI003D01CE1B
MSNQTIIVYIEEEQLVAQKVNNQSLCLAKKVNNSFTVIWLSKPPFAAPNQPTYQYKNTLNITSNSYMVNFTNTPLQQGDVNFTSGGKNLPINTGQITTLSQYGVFTPARNGGTPGDVSINNQLPANPSEILLDSTGLNLWVNCTGGMNIGVATMTPQNEFQLWFGPTQAAGTLIPSNLSNPYVVSVNDGETKTVTYTNSGVWVSGEPMARLTTEEVMALHARVDRAVMQARTLRRSTSP